MPAHLALPPGETRQQVIEQILQAMRDAGLPPAYGFVNGVRLTQEPGTEGVLEKWRAAGNLLGNHGWSHMNLQKNTAQAFEADVEANEPLLKSLMGDENWRWLRFPYLAEGETEEKRLQVRAFLAAKGYRIAAVTMGFGDHAWNPPYARCVAKHDSAGIQQLEETYLAAAVADADYRRARARAEFGHDIPYVLLMHVGAMDARMLPRLLAMYKQKGFQFITLAEAESDPYYAAYIDLSPGVRAPAHDAGKAMPRLPHAPSHIDVKSICQ